MCPGISWVFPLREKACFGSLDLLPTFKLGCLFSYCSSVYFEYKISQIHIWQAVFMQSVACLSILSMMSFREQKFLIFIMFSLPIFFYIKEPDFLDAEYRSLLSSPVSLELDLVAF